jgi:TBC1 domain family member 15
VRIQILNFLFKDKDVLRTDRTNPYFEGDYNQNLEVMHDILMTYNMYNFDLGYVQGMSDLLAPLMVIFDNEVDAFWAFVGFMNKVVSVPHFLFFYLRN